MKDLLLSIVDDFTLRMAEKYSLLERSQWWDQWRMSQFQLEKVKHVCKTFGKEVRSWEDFYSLPLTSKEDLRNLKPRKGKYLVHRTSGSSGSPVEINLPRTQFSRKEALFTRAWSWAGWKEGQWAVRFLSGKPKMAWYDWLRNVKPMNFRDITAEDLHWIVKHKPVLIHCTVFTARELIWLLKKMGKADTLKSTTLFWVGEDTGPHRKAVSKYFKDVFEGYGLAELPTIAMECEEHRMHLIEEASLTEVIEGEVVITDFYNDVTPIIRYRTGDHGKISYQKCKCGRRSPILENLKGRRVDYYDGPKVKRPIDWLVVSPISKRYLDYIQAFRAEVDLQDGSFTLKVLWRGEPSPSKLSWYRDWIEKEVGLHFNLVTVKKPFEDKYIVRIFR